ncbi:hypothetical protein TRAPUB_11833 [Trametes pubescens]|uniref:Uncharacterized protein n=1 Tax=Trametes pubescens TaxID=154538 RepID=A0A1M2VVL8_TRAPU|nr:hypothetical protein TRAPUB_11833 [Trametes pubescens]
MWVRSQCPLISRAAISESPHAYAGDVVGFFKFREHIFPAYDTAKFCRQTMCRPASFQKRE